MGAGGGLNKGRSIFDELTENRINFHVHQYGQSINIKRSILRMKITELSIKFAYVAMSVSYMRDLYAIHTKL